MINNFIKPGLEDLAVSRLTRCYLTENSKGSMVNPNTLIERYDLDALRYYLLVKCHSGPDQIFTPESFVEHNYDTKLGNLLSRYCLRWLISISMEPFLHTLHRFQHLTQK